MGKKVKKGDRPDANAAPRRGDEKLADDELSKVSGGAATGTTTTRSPVRDTLSRSS